MLSAILEKTRLKQGKNMNPLVKRGISKAEEKN